MVVCLTGVIILFTQMYSENLYVKIMILVSRGNTHAMNMTLTGNHQVDFFWQLIFQRPQDHVSLVITLTLLYNHCLKPTFLQEIISTHCVLLAYPSFIVPICPSHFSDPSSGKDVG